MFASAGVVLAALTSLKWLVGGWDTTVTFMYLVAAAAFIGVFVLADRLQRSGPYFGLLVPALTHSIANQQEVLRSDRAGCYWCLSLFSPLEEEISYRKGAGLEKGPA